MNFRIFSGFPDFIRIFLWIDNPDNPLFPPCKERIVRNLCTYEIRNSILRKLFEYETCKFNVRNPWWRTKLHKVVPQILD